jgi:hypothetical protein
MLVEPVLAELVLADEQAEQQESEEPQLESQLG